jgi:hypothetical protein
VGVARAQGVAVNDSAVLNSGGTLKPVAGATITVCTFVEANTILPCTNPLTIYSNSTLTSALGTSMTADANGNYSYFIAPGKYTETTTASMIVGRSVTRVAPCDPTNRCTITGTLIMNCTTINAVRCVSPSNPQGWSGSDIGAWINAAYANCVATSVVSCPIQIAAATYRMTTPVAFASNGVYPALSCAPMTTINYTPTSGTLITFNPGNAGLPEGWGMRGCKFSGPGKSTSSSTALLVGGSNGGVGAIFEDNWIGNVNLGLTFGSNVQSVTFKHNVWPDNNQAFLFPSVGVSVVGEAIWFINDTFACTTATWCADYFKVPTGIAGLFPDVHLLDCNLDQGSISFGSGNFEVNHIHMENPQNAVINDSYIKILGGDANIDSPLMVSEQANLPTYFIDIQQGVSTVSSPFFDNTGEAIAAAIHVCSTCGLNFSGLRNLSGSFTNLVLADSGAVVVRSDTTQLGFSATNRGTTYAIKANTGSVVSGVTGNLFDIQIPGIASKVVGDTNGNLGALGRIVAAGPVLELGTACTNAELALSAGWQSTGSATVSAARGRGQTCSWKITTGTTTAANPTVTDTLTNPLPDASIDCEMNIHGGTHTAVAGEAFLHTGFSATAPSFAFQGTPTPGGTSYFVTRRCGP